MPSGSKLKTPSEYPKSPIPPPPPSLTGAGAADIAANYSRATALAATSHASSCSLPNSNENASVLKPHSGIDIVALIFILLTVPQGVSCFLLTAYILSNSFKNLAGKLIAKCFIRFDSGSQYTLETSSQSRYYRSELIGEFLQLFSINSFILLVCHYTMPHSWFQYLIVLAKSIIASRMIGSYCSGSNTYVSVVSSSSANPGVMITTTTMCNGDNSQRSQSNDFFARGFFKFLQGTFFVLATKYVIKTWLSNLSVEAVSDDLVLFYHNFVLFQESPKFTTAELFRQAIAKSPVSLQYFTSKQNDSLHGFGNSRVLEKAIIHFALDHLHIGRKTLGTVCFVIKEIITVINYAYLVLCIHVISLTISPLLKKFFILRTYSNTLDHLSSLTPDIPYGGFKKNRTLLPLPRETSTESPVVLNVESISAQPPTSPPGKIPEIQIDPLVASAKLKLDSSESVMSVSAENFKVFCMSSFASLQISPGIKPSSKTTVDRKSASTAITPSTTIMDKFYTISIQPLWSWIAAIKIIFNRPYLFSKPGTEIDLLLSESSSESKMKTALSHVSDHSVVLEDLDQLLTRIGAENISVKVNDIEWPYHDFISSTKDEGNGHLRIYALSPSMQFSIDIFKNDALVSNHLVITRGAKLENLDTSVNKAIGTLQSSLLYAIQSLSHLKADYKKQKKDDNKRVADLRRKIDAVKSKIGKLGNKETSEVRVSGKLKGLQNSAHQLESEIRDIEGSIHEHESSESKFDTEYVEEEKHLEDQIKATESLIKESETEVIRLRSELKSLGNEKSFTEMKLKKVTAKLEANKEEVSQVKNEVKALKKALLLNLQKRQARVHDRFEVIIPRIVEATDQLSEEVNRYLDGDSGNQSF